ncbi:MAG: DUF1259 domain-containing protein [Methylomonas sp.]
MMPRADLKVTVAGVHMTPPKGLASWVGFMKSGLVTMVMGDLVLLEDQVAPVMDVALANALEITALHNHFLWDNPRIMFMHIAAKRGPGAVCHGGRQGILPKSRKLGGKGVMPRMKIDTAKSKLSTDKMNAEFDVKGEINGGVYKATWGRTAQLHETKVEGAIGVNTWAAFAGNDDKALVDGDFVVHEDELQSVLKPLRAANIHIMAIHQHMIASSPE